MNTAVSTSPDCGDESRPQVSAIRTSVRNAINPPRCREQNQHRPQNGVLPCKVGREGCLSVCFTWGCRVPQRLDRLRRGLLSSFIKQSEKDTCLHASPRDAEYLSNLLTTAGYAVSHIYNSLDQSACTFQLDHFRRGLLSILVVTNVAAGIDISNNYDALQGEWAFSNLMTEPGVVACLTPSYWICNS